MPVAKLPHDTIFPPCEYIADELRHRGWGTQRFAEELGVPDDVAAKMIDGETKIDSRLAARLAKCFGTSSTLWYRLQRSHDARIQQPKRRNP